MSARSRADVTDLRRRVDELELIIVRILGAVAILALLSGLLRPWILDGDEDSGRVYRLGTFALQAIGLNPDHRALEVALALGFALLSLSSLAAIGLVITAMNGEWPARWVTGAVIGLLVCCLVGAGLMTIVAAGRTSSSVPGEVHWGTYLLWVFGVLLSCWVLRTQLGRGARS